MLKYIKQYDNEKAPDDSGALQNKLFSCFWEKQEQHGSYGGLPPSIACAGGTSAYTMRFHLTPGIYYTHGTPFPQALCMTFVCVCETLCRAFKCLHGVFLFSPPLMGWSIHTGGLS